MKKTLQTIIVLFFLSSLPLFIHSPVSAVGPCWGITNACNAGCLWEPSSDDCGHSCWNSGCALGVGTCYLYSSQTTYTKYYDSEMGLNQCYDQGYGSEIITCNVPGTQCTWYPGPTPTSTPTNTPTGTPTPIPTPGLGGHYNMYSSMSFPFMYEDGDDGDRLAGGLDNSDSDTINDAVLTIYSGLLTINVDETVAVGSIVFSTSPPSTGSIAIAKPVPPNTVGAVIKLKSPIWFQDPDNDGYPSAQKAWIGTAPSGGKRRNAFTTVEVDCNPIVFNATNVCCIANGVSCSSNASCCSTLCGTDADSDTHFSTALGESGTCKASGTPGDCDDAQANVYLTHAACYWDLDKDTYTNGNTSGNTCLNNASCALATYGNLGNGAAPTSYTTGQLLNSANATDCNDSASITNANQVWSTTTCYIDIDNDNYTNSSIPTCTNNTTCGSATYASVGQATVTNYSAGNLQTTVGSGVDCCDTDVNAKPGQTSYYSTPRTTCGGYDYNCDTVETKLDTTIYVATTCGTFGESCLESTGTTGWDVSVPACGASNKYWLPVGGCTYFKSRCTPNDSGSTTYQSCR